jgi:hypothetical protein
LCLKSAAIINDTQITTTTTQVRYFSVFDGFWVRVYFLVSVVGSDFSSDFTVDVAYAIKAIQGSAKHYVTPAAVKGVI